MFQRVMCKFCGVCNNREARGTLPRHIPSRPQEGEDMNSKMNSKEVLVALVAEEGLIIRRYFERDCKPAWSSLTG